MPLFLYHIELHQTLPSHPCPCLLPLVSFIDCVATKERPQTVPMHHTLQTILNFLSRRQYVQVRPLTPPPQQPRCPGAHDKSSKDTGHTQDQVQSFFWTTAQQGNTFVPGKESKQSRTKRAKKAIEAIDRHFFNPAVPQQQGHGAGARDSTHNGTSRDLNGISQQFSGYTHY